MTNEYLHDVRAEVATLSAVMIDPPRLAEVQAILPTPECFWHRPNRYFYEAILAVHESGQQLDVVTLADRLVQMKRYVDVPSSYIAQVIDGTPSIGHVQDHARIVLDKYRLRLAVHKCEDIIAVCRQGKAGDAAAVQLLLEETERDFGQIAHQSTDQDLRPVRDVFVDALGALQIARARGGSLTGVDTGLSRLNNKTGGLHETDLVIIAGRPGSGKSSLATCLARNGAGTGDGVAFFSLEMPAVQLAYRLIATEAQVNVSLFRTPAALRPKEWTSLTDGAKALEKLPIWIDDTPAITVSKIRARVRKLKSEIASAAQPLCQRLRVVFVDYIQLCQGAGYNREQEVASVSRELKALAMQEKVCVVALSQLNRAVETRRGTDNRPQLSDLRESGAIEQDADAVIFVFRAEMYDKNDPALRGLADLIIGKQRNGATGVVRTQFTEEYCRFRTLTDEYDDAELPGDGSSSWYEDG